MRSLLFAAIAVASVGCGGNSAADLPPGYVLHVSLTTDGGQTKSITLGPHDGGGQTIWFENESTSFDMMIGPNPGAVVLAGWDQQWWTTPGANQLWSETVNLPGGQDASVSIDMTHNH